MNKNRNTPILIKISFLFITAWCASNALASLSLTNIPIAAWQTNSSGEPDLSNDAHGISPDGRFVIGQSYPDGNKGYLYDLNNGTLLRPNGEGAVPQYLRGIAYRTDTNQAPAQTQLILDGHSSGYQTDWMTADGGLTWGAKRRNTSFTLNTYPVANSLAATTDSDAFYTLIRNSSQQNAYTLLGVGLWTTNTGEVPTMTYINKGVNSPSTLAMNAVAGTGRVGGYRNDGGGRYNYVMDYPPASGTAFSFNGLDGTTLGEVFSISQDGSNVFGHSPVPDPFTYPGRWPYKAVLTTDVPGSPSSLVSISQLPWFPDTTGATGNAGVPYACTVDSKYAAGMSYRGTEKATLWDTSDPDPANWKATDLTDLAAANGIPDVFLRLTRAYGVATNAAGDIVITGQGADTNVPARTRAFVMTVPKSVAAVGFWLPPKPRLTISGSFGSYTLSYPSTLGTTNYVDYTTSLTPVPTWTPISTNEGTGAPIEVYDASPAEPQRFYRVRVTF